MEVVEVERTLLVLKGIGVSQKLEETIQMMLGTPSFDLEEHNKQIRAEVIGELVVKLEKDMPSKLDKKERYGYTVALTIAMEYLKEQKWQ